MFLLSNRCKIQPSEELRKLKCDPPLDVGEINAADATRKELDQENVRERSLRVSSSTARMPYVGLRGKYNKHWYVDVVTLPHNSLRLLMLHLFTILSAMQRLAIDMTHDDFKKAFGFISEFNCYLRVLFEAEEKILYKLVENKLKRMKNYETNPLHPIKRAVTKSRIIDLFDNVMADDVRRNPSADTATEIHARVDKFASQLLQYFYDKECTLPGFVSKSLRGSRERTRLEGQLIDFFRQLGLEAHYSAILAFPLRLQKVRNDFSRRHFPSQSKKQDFENAVQHVNQNIFGVAKSFEAASRQYESVFSLNEFLTSYGASVVGE